MLKKLCVLLSVSLVIVLPSLVLADANQDRDTSQKQMESTATEIFKRIGGTVKSIKQAPVNGLYEVVVEKDGKSGIVYLDQAGKHLMQGMILDIDSLQPVYAHSQEMLQSKQATSLDVNKIPVKYAIIMGNPNGMKKLYVFSDPDCPYCHSMHAELKKLAKIAPDVAIHVMLFPLPMHPGAYDKARIILETMSLDVLDKAFEGKDVPKPTKESSKTAVDEIIRFATENGIDGTPTLVLGSGKFVVGIRNAESLKSVLK